MTDLYTKYDKKAPRYTSYPPMPYWNKKVDSETWLKCLSEGLKDDPRVDLYLHIPFCEKLCWYCGCNRVITKDKSRGEDYSRALAREYEIYKSRLGSFGIRSVHLGGGTPNFLTPSQLRWLLGVFAPDFMEEEFEGAIEVDPRTCDPEHLKVLGEFGFKRISFGVQDFDHDVQVAINRIQPFEMVRKVCQDARNAGFTHINLDLIWGLPKQSVRTIENTIQLAKELGPEQISFYSYAHLPSKFTHQNLIKDEDILKGSAKRELYDKGKELLEGGGYLEIGMDHYAKKGSILANAATEGKLTRNFMGYTDAKAANLLGLGSSSISSNQYCFAQNRKEVKAYMNETQEGRLPVVSGHLNGKEDLLRGMIIQDLMCNIRIKGTLLARLPEASIPRAELLELRRDGLLEKTGEDYVVTPLGKTFIRGIACLFDQYHEAGQGRGETFSQTV